MAAAVLLENRQFQGEVAEGLNFSVVCAEDLPVWPDPDPGSLAATFLGGRQLEVLRSICGFWPRGPVDADFHEPVASDVPVLLLSGQADPITPPAYAERVATHLDHALSLVLPDLGHGMARVGCMPRLMNDFLSAREPLAIDTGCLDSVTAFPLFTSPLGPAP